MMKQTLLAAALIALGSGSALADNPYEAKMKAYFEANIRPIVADAMVINAVKDQNSKTGGLSAADIDAQDKQWRAEVKAGSPFVNGVLNNALSAHLKQKVAGLQPVVTEIFVMDAKGLNVGQSSKTSDYMQGDEDKHSKTYQSGNAKSVFVDEVEEDDGKKVAQISGVVSDRDGKPIGAVTVALAVEQLK